MITVIGLGYNDGDVTLRGAAAIDDADTVIVKTAFTDTYKLFEDIRHIVCDGIYEKTSDFNQLNEELARFVIEKENGNTVYCVGGAGFDDRSVILLKQLRPDIKIIAGSGAENVLLSDYPTTNYLAVSAFDLDDESFDYDSSQTTLVIKEIDSDYLSSVVKRFLERTVGDEYSVNMFIGGEYKKIPVYEIDRQQNYAYDTTICVEPELITKKEIFNYMDLLRIMRTLRGDNGCEWDKAQTHESIRQNAVEEAYELVDAINNNDVENIIEESGDVILQGAFHTVIGEDEGEFEAQEVLSTLGRKLVTRHPHVFGNVVAENAEKALESWTAEKSKEKNAKTPIDKMFRIATALPASMRALKLQKIACDAGLDFESEKQIIDKISEELKEYTEAEKEFKENEAGDLLFSVVNLLRFKSINPEIALGKSNEKFMNRAIFYLKECDRRGIDSKKLTIEEADEIWNKAKAAERKSGIDSHNV